VGNGVYPWFIETFRVPPNEFVLEQRYLEFNMHHTRMAYGLDKMEEREFAVGGFANWDELMEYSDSIENIPLLGYAQTQTVFTQVQGLRYYYRFNDIDIDRYTINGRLTQVMIGPRELLVDALPSDADTWVNRHLKFTHGFGAVATPVKDFTPEGQPILWVRDIPPITNIPELRIDEPRIYFGELTWDYVIVGTASQEFDFPTGDGNVENTYSGPDGLSISSMMERILFSMRLGTLNPILTNEITPESRILLYRNIVERVHKIAPFLLFDPDPYMVIHQGRLVWIIDAYTVSSNFPYSTPWNNMHRYNYIRNSVKITIDAYDGQPTFYIADPSCIVLQVYQRIFPDLFVPLDEMPLSLQAHLRYPEALFTIQANKLLLYHMTDARVMYNQEDRWSFATQLRGGVPVPMEPYYSLMRFPDFEREEFMIVLALTPVNRDNMVGLLAGRSDGENLGRLFLYRLPVDTLIYGPAQIQARINQDATISQDLALWRQSGASIEWGHMITVPLRNSLLYVNPLYIRSAATALPELKRIVLAYDQQLVMEETLEAALFRLFGLPPGQATPGVDFLPGGDDITFRPPIHAAPYIAELIEQLISHYDRVQQAFSAGDWAGYGEAMRDLESLIRELERIEFETE
jgi:hypothetical protein